MSGEPDPLSMKFEVWDTRDLGSIVRALRLDLREHPGRWSNRTLHEFFGAMQGWLDSYPQPYLDGDGTVVDNTGRLLADAMLAARSGSAITDSDGQARFVDEGRVD